MLPHTETSLFIYADGFLPSVGLPLASPLKNCCIEICHVNYMYLKFACLDICTHLCSLYWNQDKEHPSPPEVPVCLSFPERLLMGRAHGRLVCSR